jgi:triosephosphate isomerase
MRKKIVAGNWKMNTTLAEGVELAKGITEQINDISKGVSLIVAPPFTHLAIIAQMLKGTPVAVSAQNCADQPKGAFTGEVSAAMLKSVGCTYTILGHSERREYYGETSEKLVKKMALAFENGLKVIFCVGEKLEERNEGNHFDVVAAQLSEVLFGLEPQQMKNVIVAYEPVWAIGTGVTATDE